MAAYASREGAVPDAVRTAWDAMRPPEGVQPYRDSNAWNDPARHDELLRLVTQYDGYVWAAGRYREVVRANPDDAIAKQQLDRLRKAAEITLLASATVREDRGPKPYRATITVLAMMIIALIAGVLYAMVLDNRIPSATPARPGPSQAVQPLRPR
jgi:hypothetical protein